MGKEAEVVNEDDQPKTSEEQVPEKKADFQLTTNGTLGLVTISEQMSFGQKLITEKMISSTFKTPQQVLIGMQYAKNLKLDVIPALRMMYVVNGRPCLWGDGPLSMVQKTMLVDGLEEFYTNEKMEKICFANKNLKDIVYCSFTRIKRKGDSEWQEDYFTVDDMNRAGLNMNKYGIKDTWKKYERIMLRYKARTLALKSKFADKINGIDIAEYDHHFSPEVPDVDPTQKPKNDINDGVGALS